jgi:DNA-binding MarR family transcriptional regulator
MNATDATPMDCNCFALRQAARFVSQIYERHMGKAGVSATQMALLSVIRQKPGCSMAEAADSMVMDRTTLVRALKPLQRDGLVEMGAAGGGTRAVALDLTEAGGAVLAQAAVQWRAAQDEFEARYGLERARALRAALFELTAAH